MYLKSMTLRGFKSFASATRLELEPGITCVVGPNGSGKSNVVDALAWVMGEQGAKNLRGGKMDDVIFAGTANRQALGRAEVTLTIDNTDGAIPIDYTEVTIARTMFRTGGSEYAVNGESARLLDIQELLNDSGLGKEMHVIVGQGRLDQILHADPVERRSFIEEAAGVLKHRRRKDKALRKLTGLQANLDRVCDLRNELAEQLGPLGRQAKAARRAAGVQALLRDSGARLLADDVVQVQAKLESGGDAAGQARAREQAESALAELDAGIAERQTELKTHEDHTDGLGAALRRLGAMTGRARALAQRAEDRKRYLSEEPEPTQQREPPEALDARAKRYGEEHEQARATKAEREAQVQQLALTRDDAQARLQQIEEGLRAQRAAAAGRVRDRTQAESAVEQARKQVADAESGLRDLAEQRDALRAEHAEATAALDSATADARESEGGEAELDAAYESAAAAQASAQDNLRDLDERRAGAAAELDQIRARAEALGLGARLQAQTADLLALRVPGVDNAVGELIDIAPGYEQAVTAALGATAQAVLAADLDAALALLAHLDDDAAADIVIAGPAVQPTAPTAPRAPDPDALPVPARDLVTTGHRGLGALLDELLADTQVCTDATAAARLLARPGSAGCTFATMTGEVAAARRVTRPVNSEGSRIAARKELDDATARAADLESDLAGFDAGRPAAAAQVEEAAAAAATALEELHASDARIMAAGQQVSQAAAAVERLAERQHSVQERAEQLRARRDAARAAAQQADAALAALSDRTVESEPDTTERDQTAARIAALGEELMEARIALRAASDRTTFLAERITALKHQAEEARHAQQRAAHEARLRRARAQRAQQITTAAWQIHELLAGMEAAAESRLAGAKDERERLAGELERQRAGRSELGDDLARLTQEENEARLVRERYVLQLEELGRRAEAEAGLSLEHLVEQFGPHLPVPVLDPEQDGGGAAEQGDHGLAGRENGDPADPGAPAETVTVPFVRSQVAKTHQRAERELKSIGKVNPLALEEYQALRERHDFLQRQVDDIEATRKDLLGLVAEVDRHVQEVFSAAFADTQREFEAIFARLFPGGEGSLTLTDPDDLLGTGVDVHARPAGKKVKRLSLLSGGERSLVAVAMLVAIFKARPSPFYVMDEVEAALDDVNLQRLLTVFEELQESSQLIVITHQKRTMEIADALYGVTMGDDGVSKVISQRLVHRTEDGRGPDAGDSETPDTFEPADSESL